MKNGIVATIENLFYGIALLLIAIEFAILTACNGSAAGGLDSPSTSGLPSPTPTATITPTAIPTSYPYAIAVSLEAAWEGASLYTTFMTKDQCKITPVTLPYHEINCTAYIPEAQLHFSTIRFNFEVAPGADSRHSCDLAIFEPYEYLIDWDAAPNPWYYSPGPKPADFLKRLGGARHFFDWGLTSYGKYFLPAITTFTEFTTTKSINQLSMDNKNSSCASNIGLANAKSPAPTGTLIPNHTPANFVESINYYPCGLPYIIPQPSPTPDVTVYPGDAYTAIYPPEYSDLAGTVTMKPYRFRCQDRWGQDLYKINVYISDDHSFTNPIYVPPPTYQTSEYHSKWFL